MNKAVETDEATAAVVPPKVITVDTQTRDDENDHEGQGDDRSEASPSANESAQTPKHANKKDDSTHTTASTSRMSIGSGSTGAFQPREPARYYQRYYESYDYGAHAPSGYPRYAMYPPPPPPPHHYEQGPSWGASGPYGVHPGHPAYDPNNYTRTNPNFSRAVSSSFDRSVKSRELPSTPVADDASWGQLNQVTSVDEDEMRKRKQRPPSAESSISDKKTPDSPESQSTASLDILKCPSGSSALMLPTHPREMSQLSFQSKEESRHEKESVGPPASKKKKSSPLSITCSPPGSPKPTKPLHPQPVYAKTEYRPGSSAASSEEPQPSVQQLPSWEIYGQDSFGGGSQLQGALSFGQDYLALSASASQEEGRLPPATASSAPPPPPPPASHPSHPSAPAIESRNQSFDQTQYFQRSDSMISYDGSRQGYEPPRVHYQGHYPVQAAPSWGSASSYPQHPYYPPPPPINRTGSYDNRFQPPPEFRAPPSMVKTQSTPSATIVSNYGRKKPDTPFSWSKEEDNRLSDVMKKYKNPRDWEPIAKELNAGRTAKECHERWIRYLKPGVRKGQWTDHEDAIVMEAVSSSAEQPFTRWSDLAQRLPGRVGKQIRDRWVNHLNPNINHLPFSREDDLRLWEGHQKLGKRWVEISTKYFQSSRSENHIKNRWYSASFKKFISNEFGADAYAGTKSPRKKK